MSFFQHKFNSNITLYCADPNGVEVTMRREANSQLDRIVAAMKAKGEDHHSCTAFMGGGNLSYEWSLNTDVGVETLAIYRTGWTVPLIVVDRQLPWHGKPNHTEMSKFVEHHVGKATEGAQFRGAAIAVAEMLNELIVKWRKIDLHDAERHMPALALEKVDLELLS